MLTPPLSAGRGPTQTSSQAAGSDSETLNSYALCPSASVVYSASMGRSSGRTYTVSGTVSPTFIVKSSTFVPA